MEAQALHRVASVSQRCRKEKTDEKMKVKATVSYSRRKARKAATYLLRESLARLHLHQRTHPP